MERKLPAAVATAPSRFGTRNLEIASRRWTSTRAGTFRFISSFSSSFSIHGSVDSCPDFLQFQGLLCGVESRWKTNRQRQCRPNHQDLGLAIWRLPVDADRALGSVSCFESICSKKLPDQSCSCLSVRCEEPLEKVTFLR